MTREDKKKAVAEQISISFVEHIHKVNIMNTSLVRADDDSL